MSKLFIPNKTPFDKRYQPKRTKTALFELGLTWFFFKTTGRFVASKSKRKELIVLFVDEATDRLLDDKLA